MSDGPTRYYLYIPVWATGRPPQGGGSSENSTLSTPESTSSTPSSTPTTPSMPSSYTTSGDWHVTTGSDGTPTLTWVTTNDSRFSRSSGGGTGSGSGPGGSGPGGSGPGGSNCLLFGTLVRLADGRITPIENLRPGDLVASIRVPGLEVDAPYRAQYNWLSHHGLDDATRVVARVAGVRLGEHQGFVVINRRLKATPEHPVLIRRGDQWGFASAEFVRPGDRLIDERGREEPVESVVRVEAPARTAAVHIAGTNMLLAEGVWIHNDMPISATTVSGSGSSSSSGSSKSSSSSFSSSSSGSQHTTMLSISESFEPGQTYTV